MSCGLCGLPGAFGMCVGCRENTDNVPDEDEKEGKKTYLFGEIDNLFYPLSMKRINLLDRNTMKMMKNNEE